MAEQSATGRTVLIAGAANIFVGAIKLRVDFGGDISADQAEEIADEIDKRLVDRLPQATHVFLDPTRRPSAAHHPANAGRPKA